MTVVRTRIEGRTAVLGLRSPPANALSEELLTELRRALDECEAAGARAIVLTSDIDGYFVAGADVRLLARQERAAFASYLGRVREVVERVAALDALSLAAIDGYALGGGLELAMACTLRVVSPRARLGVPEVKLGLLPGAGGTQRLPRLAGRGAALDLLLTGRNVGGSEAVEMGLATRLADDPVEMALHWAGELAAGANQAQAAIRRCVDAALTLPMAEGMALERAELLELFASADAREGTAAFLDKRPPRFEDPG